MKFRHLFPLLTVLSLLVLPACFNDHDNKNDYSNWRALNEFYIDSLSTLMEDGEFLYQQIIPTWDQSFAILMRWHDEGQDNSSSITPFSTSQCYVKYTLTNISGDTLDSSNSFACVPNNLVTGFMAALTNMHEKDTVTAVIPYAAGYGAYGYGNVLPYSTLVFGIRLDSISKLF